METSSPLPLRGLGVLSVVQGAAYLLATRRLLELVAGRPPAPAEVPVTRVLGARLVVQGVVLCLAPASELPRVGRRTAAVDGVHGLSMAALAGASPRHRPVALASALSAFTSALATYALVPRPRHRRYP
ncbi:hypothetical protein RKE38_16800 [Phycicoccus sp. M110.8]|uniref:hypothetical protein n=1 Tax=Phycicoccus sp. M110.8 TaxID=3075433 RepID=UPI0028FD45DC|nr:hypothetical protein [Phycicoccus sp. M110.8]MDU0315359.1 hypothetical protein [Phycicoccus sp. M110.8]